MKKGILIFCVCSILLLMSIPGYCLEKRDRGVDRDQTSYSAEAYFLLGANTYDINNDKGDIAFDTLRLAGYYDGVMHLNYYAYRSGAILYLDRMIMSNFFSYQDKEALNEAVNVYSDMTKTSWYKDVIEGFYAYNPSLIETDKNNNIKIDEKLDIDYLSRLLVVFLGQDDEELSLPIDYTKKALELGLYNGIVFENNSYLSKGELSKALTNTLLQPIGDKATKLNLPYKEVYRYMDLRVYKDMKLESFDKETGIATFIDSENNKYSYDVLSWSHNDEEEKNLIVDIVNDRAMDKLVTIYVCDYGDGRNIDISFIQEPRDYIFWIDCENMKQESYKTSHEKITGITKTGGQSVKQIYLGRLLDTKVTTSLGEYTIDKNVLIYADGRQPRGDEIVKPGDNIELIYLGERLVAINININSQDL